MTKLKMLFRKLFHQAVGYECNEDCRYNLNGRCYKYLHENGGNCIVGNYSDGGELL